MKNTFVFCDKTRNKILWKLQSDLHTKHYPAAYKYAVGYDWIGLLKKLEVWEQAHIKYSETIKYIKNIFIPTCNSETDTPQTLLSRMDCENLIGFPLPDYFPLCLEYYGNPEILKRPKVGIVGSRHPTLYGREQCYLFTKALSEAGIVVISGGAIGIDTIANATAVKNYSCCVLGSGLKHPYPPSNITLFNTMKHSNGSLILSQFHNQTKPNKGNFPKRNVTLAGLCNFLLVIEATKTSGSLITAQACLEMGRDVGALPGPVDNINSEGTNWLIQNGAFCVQNPANVLDHISKLL